MQVVQKKDTAMETYEVEKYATLLHFDSSRTNMKLT